MELFQITIPSKVLLNPDDATRDILQKIFMDLYTMDELTSGEVKSRIENTGLPIQINIIETVK